MPELPEVETTRRGIEPHVCGRRIETLIVRDPRLRWPVPRHLCRSLTGATIRRVRRRAKYLLLETDTGTLILHLGMSGSLCILPMDTPAGRHDHADIVFDDGTCLRLHDPRRFGSLHWTTGDPRRHRLLRDLGPEPLEDTFSGDYLYHCARHRRVAVKQFLMDSHKVAGIGNIYACEALYRAGIHPARPAGRIARPRYERLVEAIRTVLREAIDAGGTTLRDFTGSDGRPGYFRLRLSVYEREGQPCPACGRTVKKIRQGQRSTYYCSRCQH